MRSQQLSSSNSTFTYMRGCAIPYNQWFCWNSFCSPRSGSHIPSSLTVAAHFLATSMGLLELKGKNIHCSMVIGKHSINSESASIWSSRPTPQISLVLCHIIQLMEKSITILQGIEVCQNFNSLSSGAVTVSIAQNDRIPLLLLDWTDTVNVSVLLTRNVAEEEL